MKKRILLTALLVLTLVLALASCKGDKAIESLSVTEGLKTVYELDEVPDFSAVKVRVTYNDGSTKDVGADQLTFSKLDTSVIGTRKLTITYEDKTLDVNVEVKGKTIDTVTLTGIKYFAGLPAKIFQTKDPIDTILLEVVATYSDGTEATVKGNALTTNIADLDFNTPGEKTVVISYNGKTCQYVITVEEIKIEKLRVDSTSINTVVPAGETLDLSGIKVYAVYNNGNETLINRDDADLDLTTGMPDLNAEGDKDYVISYKGTSVTIKITTTEPLLESIELKLNDAVTTIIKGDAFSTAPITAIAHLSNLTTDTVANSDLVFTTVETATPGTYTVKVSYTRDDITKEASFDVTVLGITSIAIDTGSISTNIVTGEALDTTRIAVLVTASDGNQYKRTANITVDTSKLNTNTVGTYTINATYQGVKSADVSIIVYDEDTNYYITNVQLPESLTFFTTNALQDAFKIKDVPYVVGDDNPFKFALILSAYTAEGEKKENITNYTGASTVVLVNEDGSTTAADAAYVAIDEANNTFDFTDAAIGKTFVITTRPRDGVEGKESEYSRSLTVKVVDGYNITKAYELNYMTNWSAFDFSGAKVYGSDETRSQVQIVDDFLKNEWSTTRPAALNGMVIHNDLFIEPGDIPAEYFLTKNRTLELYDRINVFSHMNTAANPHFTIYGNYFTICSNALPTVVALGKGNQDDIVSNGQLFGFDVDSSLKSREYDHTLYSTSFENVYIRDDHPTKDTPETTERDMRGLIGMKTWGHVININNTIFEAFYISHLADGDYQTVNINDSIYYNSWQNHLFLWSKNYVDDDDTAPIANYPTLTLNVTNSSITKSGGPVIISQVSEPKLACNQSSNPTVNFVGSEADLWTYVTGEEAWFNSMGEGVLGAVAQQVIALDPLLKGYTGGSFVTTNPNVEGLADGDFINIILANLAAGMDLNATLHGTEDLDGTLNINGDKILDMTDIPAMGLGYAHPAVAMIKKASSIAPVFVSSEGGIGMVNQNQDGSYYLVTDIYQMLYSQTVLAETPTLDHATFCAIFGLNAADLDFANTLKTIDAQNKVALGYGNYVTLYYNNMGIVLGYNIDDATRHQLP